MVVILFISKIILGRRVRMIKLTKFQSKGIEFILNAELIETIEATPDTVITLVNGKKIIVEENMREIVARAMEYKRALGRFTR